jgi:hypothetical protein
VRFSFDFQLLPFSQGLQSLAVPLALGLSARKPVSFRPTVLAPGLGKHRTTRVNWPLKTPRTKFMTKKEPVITCHEDRQQEAARISLSAFLQGVPGPVLARATKKNQLMFSAPLASFTCGVGGISE